MPSREQRLKRLAQAAAQWRGHNLSTFGYGGRSGRFYAECWNCGRYAMVISDPLPNETDISGDAVAVGCERTE